MCRLNNVVPRIVQTALGLSEGFSTLYYSELDTWDGKLAADSNLECFNKAINNIQKSETVPISKLDDYSAEMPESGILIKIDVEGMELDVLLGGRSLILLKRPLIIFEENGCENNRIRLFRFFREIHYVILRLPFESSSNMKLCEKKFVRSSDTNFIAIYVSRDA